MVFFSSSHNIGLSEVQKSSWQFCGHRSSSNTRPLTTPHASTPKKRTFGVSNAHPMVVFNASAVAVRTNWCTTRASKKSASTHQHLVSRQFQRPQMSALTLGPRSNNSRSRASSLTTKCASSVRDLPDDQRVVITGAGVVSTAGNDRATFFGNLCSGKSGVIDLTKWKPGLFDQLPTRIGAPILDLDAQGDLTLKEIRRMDKVHQYAVVAGKRALRDAGLWGDTLDGMDKTKCGVLVGSAMGGLQVFEDNVLALHEKGIKKVSPFTVPYMLTNMSGAILGMQPELQFRGPNYALNTACATSNYQVRVGAFPNPGTGRFDAPLWRFEYTAVIYRSELRTLQVHCFTDAGDCSDRLR